MTDIVQRLRLLCQEEAGNEPEPGSGATAMVHVELLVQAATRIEQLSSAVAETWQPIRTAPKDEGPLLLFCPGVEGHAARGIVIGTWCFDPNRRSLGYWTSDIGRLDQGFAETGPWIEYPELQPELWAPLPALPSRD